ncbi:MAG: protein-L-isoaspartate(D-aspartate) O-methyltransferase [bacterium]
MMLDRYFFILQIGIFSYIVMFNQACKQDNNCPDIFKNKRENMVKKQIQERGIKNDKVLKVIGTIPRHKFVPKKYQDQAYEDHPLSIGFGQTISQPYIVALMTEVLKLDHTKKVLEIGTGSGYQTAVLAEICSLVYSIEIVEPLAKTAQGLINELGYKNTKIKFGDGYKGWEENSPFDAIIVTCAPSHIPGPLKEQLAEGGKMVIPVGGAFTQELVLILKENGALKEKEIIPVSFVPMVGENGRSY